MLSQSLKDFQEEKQDLEEAIAQEGVEDREEDQMDAAMAVAETVEEGSAQEGSAQEGSARVQSRGFRFICEEVLDEALDGKFVASNMRWHLVQGHYRKGAWVTSGTDWKARAVADPSIVDSFRDDRQLRSAGSAHGATDDIRVKKRSKSY